jgi:hypothetical protein
MCLLVRFWGWIRLDSIFWVDAPVVCQFALLLFGLPLVETEIELFAHRAQHRLEVLSHYYYIGRTPTSRLSQIIKGPSLL